MANEKETRAKIEFIESVFRKYQPNLSLIEQISLLTNWINACSSTEEYEMAGALNRILQEIEKNPLTTPQRTGGDLDSDALMKDNPLFKSLPEEDPKLDENDFVEPLTVKEEKKKKPSIYKRIINSIKRFFNGGFIDKF